MNYVVEMEKIIDSQGKRIKELEAENGKLCGQIDDAVVELAKANGLYSECLNGNRVLRDNLTISEERQTLLRAALEQVEWGWVQFGRRRGCVYLQQCAWCRGSKDDGHKSGCPRQLALNPI